MLTEFAMGIAAVLYVGVGWLQESIGLIPAMSFSYLLLLPGALLAFAVLPERRTLDAATGQAALAVGLAGASCPCATANSAGLVLDTRGQAPDGERSSPALPQACACAASN